MNKYMCDFETSTEEWLVQDDGVARVWAACICTIEEEPKIIAIDNNIDDFMENLIKLGNCETYFHNLKYDGEYIVSWLLTHGYTWDEKAKEEKQFTTIISDTGMWYSITITHKKFNKRYVRTHIYDSLKKIPLKVSQISKAFNIPELKGSIDYDMYRPVGWNITDEEKDYIKNDVIIVAKALHQQFSEGLEKLTIGSDALSCFKEMLGGKKAFKYLYPVLALPVDNDIRKSYKGGFCMVNERYRNKEVSGISFDVNSLYPSVMYGNMGPLPYGQPKIFEGEYEYDEHYPLYIVKFSCSFKVKKNMIPTIQLKHNLCFIPTEYIKESHGIVDMVLTSVDLELFFKHYDVKDIEWVGGYKFKCNNDMFKEYIDRWMKVKANSTGGLRQLAKLMLNSLYGKFATNPKMLSKRPTIDDGLIELTLNEPEYIDPVYTALGTFVTSYARAYTISNSQALYDHWVYSDTDSMYLTGITEDEAAKYINIHPSNLGAWKLEHHFNRGKWLRPKTYIIDSTEDGLSIACAGMPQNIKEQFNLVSLDTAFKSFTYGSKFTGKLVPRRVKGGVVLCKTDFTIMHYYDNI